jgi:DNA processing protein
VGEEEVRALLRLAARPRGASEIPSLEAKRAIERAIRLLARSGGRAVSVQDRACPAGLSSLAGGPRVVFLAGAWDHPGPMVAVVGARDASDDGCDVARGLARSLAGHGVAVVSGLARGIDAAAHRGALEAGGRSGAVLGTGLERVYPKEHRALQRDLAGSLGLLSALVPGSPPTRKTFASRNRILAAISDAVVVVQGREGSGALLTASAATRLGRPVAALPWDSRDPLGSAPHALIRSGAATLVRGAEDVLELLEAGRRRESPSAAPAGKAVPAPATGAPLAGAPAADAALSIAPPAGSREERLWSALRERPEPLERAAHRADLTIAEAAAAFVLLEIAGRARREPGGAVRRVGRR